MEVKDNSVLSYRGASPPRRQPFSPVTNHILIITVKHTAPSVPSQPSHS